MYENLLDAAQTTPTIRTADLMSKWCRETASPEARGWAKRFKTVERAIQRKKAANSEFPSLPNKPTFEELCSIPESAKLTSDGQIFLISNLTMDQGKRILTFASPFSLSLLSKSEH